MKRKSKIEIVFADDRPVVLYGLQSWFESSDRFRVSACVRNADKLLARLKTTSYDVIVLSCGMEGSPADDFAFLREMRAACPDTPVVVFTGGTNAHALAETQRAGAAGLVSMREGAGEFERVCERVLSGATGIVSARIAAYRDAAVSSDAAPDYCGESMSVTQLTVRV